jgi:hypothetical protein
METQNSKSEKMKAIWAAKKAKIEADKSILEQLEESNPEILQSNKQPEIEEIIIDKEVEVVEPDGKGSWMKKKIMVRF